MNFAYFRKSTFPLEKTIANVKELAAKENWKLLGEAQLPNDQGKMLLICRPEWVGTVVQENHQLIGFLPCAVTVFQKGGDVLIGSGQPAIIKALAQSKPIADLAAHAEVQIKELIHAAAGVEALQPSQVTLYSTQTCPYCKMEKSWLDSKQVKHEVIYVDQDQTAAQKMVERTGQMGVPVTEIQYADSEAEFIIGFDKPKLAAMLGVTE